VGSTQGTLPGESAAGDADAFLIELDPSGGVVDYIQFGTADADIAEGVTVDPVGRPLITGRTQGALPGETALGGEDIFVRKYDPFGIELWTTQYGTSNSDFAEGVVFDAGGYIVVSGATLGSLPGETANGNLDGFLSRIDPATGSVVWNHQYGTDESDIAHRAGTDGSGNIYATGNTDGTFPAQSNSGSFDAFLVKVTIDDLDADGLIGALDNCPNASNPGQENNDRNFLNLPGKAFDDLTQPNSDLLGDACDGDDDNDGRSDADEIAGTGCAGTDPFDSDSDGDNFLDGAECVLGFDPNALAVKPAEAACGASGDADGDGLLTRREICYYNTNPNSANTDGDACTDGREVASVNANNSVDVLDLQQVASEAGVYAAPGSPVKVDFDITRNLTIDVIDLQQTAARAGSCP
jgi:hypothetical protein